MRRLNPVATLLTITGLAAGVLLYLDSRCTPTVSEDSETLAAVTPLPGYVEKPSDRFSFSASVTETTARANSEVRLSDVPASESMQNVSIHVSGLKNQSSNLCVAIFDAAEGFPRPEHSRTTKTIPVDAESVAFSLSLPDTSITSIAIFQDLNGDGKLTKNSFGLPVEPYGFSNNARSRFGPPSFSQAAFKVSELTTSIEISVR